MAALLAVHTLTDDETIAKLSGGIQRLKFPEDQNPIRMLKAVVDARTSTTWAAAQSLMDT